MQDEDRGVVFDGVGDVLGEGSGMTVYCVLCFPSPATPPAPAPTAAPPAPLGDRTYSHIPSGATATEFSSEAAAKARCPGAAVVWVNTNSKVYHSAGTHNYRHTKEGAYMCETDAAAASDRASKIETHP